MLFVVYEELYHHRDAMRVLGKRLSSPCWSFGMTAREVEQSKWWQKYTVSVDWHVVKHGRAVVVEDCGNLVEVFGVEAAAIHLPVLLRQLVHRCPPPKRRDWPVLCKRGSHLGEWACCSKLILGLWWYHGFFGCFGPLWLAGRN